MDDGFLLDEFNEEQFESLLDNAADQLPVGYPTRAASRTSQTK